MHPMTRMSSKVIQKDFNNRFEIMEDQGHSLLKCGSHVFKAERHLSICKGTPRTNKGSLMLFVRFDLYLIVFEKSIHIGKYLTSRTLIQNLINKWCGKIILRTGTIQVTKISAYTNCSLLLINQNGVLNPLHQGNGIDESNLRKPLYIILNSGFFPRIHRT